MTDMSSWANERPDLDPALHPFDYVDPASLPVPAPNRDGELPHAYPAEHAEYSTCLACGAEVFADGTDDEGTGIWTHTATLDYFCEPVD